MKPVIADIITIGDELLIGQVVDTNSAFLANEMNTIGIRVREIFSISDNNTEIIKALNNSLQESDLIVITGGLGPTNDDITKNTLAEYFNSKLVQNKLVLADIKDFFMRRGTALSERNMLQADVPQGCRVLRNKSGTAPGMVFNKNGKLVVSLPGVPYEMKELFTGQVIPLLNTEFKLPYRIYNTILTTGISESALADRLKEWEEKLESEFQLAYLPSPGLLRLRLSISGDNKDQLKDMLNKKSQSLVELIGKEFVYGYNDETIQGAVGKLLQGAGKTLSVAESCTGGNISHLVTSEPGSSAYFKGSITAYSNNIKTMLLNIPESMLEETGAVSKEVVESMAMGVLKLMNTDYAIATSGIAGPDGGSAEKPVGTTWIAIASDKKIISKKYMFGEHRGRNIEKASFTALNMLRNMIIESSENTE